MHNVNFQYLGKKQFAFRLHHVDELFGLKNMHTNSAKSIQYCSIFKLENMQLIENLLTLPTCFLSVSARSLLLPLFLPQMEQPSMDQKGHANVPWIVEPGQEAKRGVNTKYETTIF